MTPVFTLLLLSWFLVPFDPSAFAAEWPAKLIPEIMSSKDGDEVPPQIFKKHDSRSIGHSLVARIHKTRELRKKRGRPRKGAYDYFKDTEVHLHFPQEYIPRVLENGILNSYQTGSGVTSGFDKSAAENAMVGLRLPDATPSYLREPELVSHPVNEVRAKYAELVLSADRDLGFDVGSPQALARYGDTIAVLEDQAKYRMTWTPQDTGTTQDTTG